MNRETMSLPMVTLRGITILPEMVRHFDVSRSKSLKAIEEAVEGNQKILWRNRGLKMCTVRDA